MIVVIPGFKEKPSDPQYRSLKRLLEQNGHSVKIVRINWNRRVLTDWILEFENLYAKYQGKQNTVLGFSFGAMIALATANSLKPKKLVLCSLSPYFREDLSHIPHRWKKFIGKHRVSDFEKYQADTLAQLDIPTTVLCGSKEADKFPVLKKRCIQTVKRLTKGNLILIKGASHNIGLPEYQKAIVVIL